MKFTFIQFIFFFFIIASSILSLMSSNTVYSVLFLILFFVNITFLLLLFNIEFLSLFIIIIYVGAIMVLFLFVVMLLEIPYTQEKNDFILLISSFSLVFIYEIYSKMLYYFSNIHIFSFTKIDFWLKYINGISNTETLGLVLYNFYFIVVLIAGIILLIPLLGIVLLIFKPLKTKLDLNIFKQISRSNKNAIVLINSKKKKKD